jgi:predicted DNA-binding antitoxin AbrB/MazE fold protein
MLSTHQAIVYKGEIKLLEQVDLPEGTKLLITVLQDDESDFWFAASQSSIEKIWDNPDDDLYEQLEDVAFIKQRYEEGKREKVEGITIPAEKVFAEARK